MKVLSNDSGVMGREVNPFNKYCFKGINPKWLKFERNANQNNYPFTTPQKPNEVIDCEDELVFMREWYSPEGSKFKICEDDDERILSIEYGLEVRQAFKPKEALNQEPLSHPEVKGGTVEADKNFKKVANDFEWTLDEREEIQKLLNHQHQINIDKVVEIIELTIENARILKMSDQYINGLKASLGLIRHLNTEY